MTILYGPANRSGTRKGLLTSLASSQTDGNDFGVLEVLEDA